VTARARSGWTFALSALLVVLGLVILVETVVVGGRLGYLLGALLALAGALRIYLVTRA
jgi:drug/metabolite transporter (DMT)-like permease